MGDPHGGVSAEHWDVFRHAQVWKGASDEAMEHLAEWAHAHECVEGEVLALEGVHPDEVHVLLRGHARGVTYDPDGRAVVVETLSPGQSIGLFAAVLDLPVVANAEALDHALVATLPASAVCDLFTHEPGASMSLTCALADRFVALVEVLRRNAASVPRRLASYLLATPCERRGPNSRTLELPFSRAKLADVLATSPETLSRTFATFQRQGLVRSHDRRITILDEHALEEVSQGGSDD